jgi:glyoxylase-like metal-dependent hydrolase (beta-lactamase superfamily II)
MLKQITEGVWVHVAEFLQSNALVVQGKDGLLLIDPGITSDEMSTLAKDIKQLGRPIVAGFSTHPHWDHLLWHAGFGDVPRYCTQRAAEEIRDFFSNPEWKTQAERMLPEDIAQQIPIDDLFGKTTALQAGTTELPWDGPKIQVFEHQGHATGSAAVLIKERGVLAAGDMLSDILIPFLEFDAEDPTKDYLAALDMLEGLADDIEIFVPGHGSVGDADAMRARIKQDRAYVQALRDGGGSEDPRLIDGPCKDMLASVHKWQTQQIAQKGVET